MLTLVISVVVSLAVSLLLYFTTYSLFWAIVVAVALILLMNFLIGKKFMGKLTEVFGRIEKDLRQGRNEAAIEKLKEAYPLARWQFYVKAQLDSQIGIILYTNKKFEDSRPYLENAFNKNWMAMSMKAALKYRDGDIPAVYQILEKAIKGAKKEGFLYSFYAYVLIEKDKNRDKAIEILDKGVQKNPLDERLSANLDTVKNGKKLKMEKYGQIWMQLHLGGKMQQQGQQYQQFLMNQRVKRR